MKTIKDFLLAHPGIIVKDVEKACLIPAGSIRLNSERKIPDKYREVLTNYLKQFGFAPEGLAPENTQSDVQNELKGNNIKSGGTDAQKPVCPGFVNPEFTFTPGYAHYERNGQKFKIKLTSDMVRKYKAIKGKFDENVFRMYKDIFTRLAVEAYVNSGIVETLPADPLNKYVEVIRNSL